MHPYRTTGRIVLSCILGLAFLDYRPRDEDSELNGSQHCAKLISSFLPWSDISTNDG
jgi:hypothetical protein